MTSAGAFGILPPSVFISAVIVAAATALGFGPEPRSGASPDSAGVSRKSEVIEVGDQLQAVRDVQLDAAIVAKGSKINIAGRTVAA